MEILYKRQSICIEKIRDSSQILKVKLENYLHFFNTKFYYKVEIPEFFYKFKENTQFSGV